jgi:hypothetical protein
MNSISNFELNVYSEEIYSVDEQELDEVNAMIAQESDWQGYGEWSQELEQGTIINTPHGEILINKECAHASCKTTRCERDVRVGGIAI